MNNLTGLAKNASKMIKDNSPSILSAIAVTGVFSTAVLAVKGTPQALQWISEAESEQTEPLTKAEIVKLTWKCYVPAAASGILTATCILSANSISTRRNAALISVYSMSEAAFKEYKEKVTDTIGSNKEQKIRDEIAQDKVNLNPVDHHQVIITGKGDVRCYDSLTGRYFDSSVETIRKAQNDINAQIIHEMSASQNDFYSKIGLPVVKYGDNLGWNLDNMLEIEISTVLSDDGQPCVSINYKMEPTQGFHKMG